MNKFKEFPLQNFGGALISLLEEADIGPCAILIAVSNEDGEVISTTNLSDEHHGDFLYFLARSHSRGEYEVDNSKETKQ